MQIVQDKSLERWEEYKALRLRALKDSPQAFLDTVEETQERPKKEWQRLLKNVYFTEDDGEWVGMIAAYIDEKEKLGHIMNIVGFYVMPEHRGKGMGRDLLSRVIEETKKSKNIRKLQLGVVTTQESALSLYLSFGFKKVGEMKYAVKVGDKYFDEYLMEMYI